MTLSLTKLRSCRNYQNLIVEDWQISLPSVMPQTATATSTSKESNATESGTATSSEAQQNGATSPGLIFLEECNVGKSQMIESLTQTILFSFVRDEEVILLVEAGGVFSLMGSVHTFPAIRNINIFAKVLNPVVCTPTDKIYFLNEHHQLVSIDYVTGTVAILYKDFGRISAADKDGGSEAVSANATENVSGTGPRTQTRLSVSMDHNYLFASTATVSGATIRVFVTDTGKLLQTFKQVCLVRTTKSELFYVDGLLWQYATEGFLSSLISFQKGEAVTSKSTLQIFGTSNQFLILNRRKKLFLFLSEQDPCHLINRESFTIIKDIDLFSSSESVSRQQITYLPHADSFVILTDTRLRIIRRMPGNVWKLLLDRPFCTDLLEPNNNSDATSVCDEHVAFNLIF